ncbi:MAG: homocysteine S-methyltransferase family protein [Oscillospiraceae bacterium]|jgi:5-methyltetrahydrofolate--homocysteine methyltransferase|nr:homocysteine S-methyltransferase family protein [Oscillospiraceae bacterium]
MKFIEMLKSNRLIFADGAQGTELQKLQKIDENTVSGDSPPHLLNFSNPEIVKQVARSYAEAGSDFVCANTFSINRFNVTDVDAEIKQALALTREALDGTGALTALDVTTLGQLLEPAGTLSFEQAYDIYKEIMLAGEKHGADLVILETMTDLYETKAALLALKENTNLPVICSMTFEQNGRTFTGTPAACMAATLEGLGADALGINCSLGPVELKPLVRELLNCTSLPVMVKPNAGLPCPETGEFKLSAQEFAETMAEFARLGVKILGGCCGTAPEFIRQLVGRDAPGTPQITGALKAPQITDTSRAPQITGASGVPQITGTSGTPQITGTSRAPQITGTSGASQITGASRAPHPTVCGYSQSVIINRPRIIGERINPTGKKLMKQALLDNDMGYILKQAAEQINAGADILDINVGAAGIDEVVMLPKVVKAVQGITGIPLQLDSANPAALEAALRVTNGKPIVNSVNAEEESLEAILPLVKKYGAAVVGLTLDKSGIPKKAEERLALAEKILNRALELGIKREDVFIDCLTLTASAEQESALETLKAVALVKEKLGLKTVLGVSNVSFGLPERGIINRTFLALALQSGLDLPIMNPNEKDMLDTFRAFNVLAGHDKNAAEYVGSAGGRTENTADAQCTSLHYAVLNGLKAEAVEITKKLLTGTAPLEIINTQLIPALDKAGELFETGKIFLPQLMLSAETAAACFEIVKTRVGRDTLDTPHESANKIILATVKGDIHDIGKNIVRTLLESYGYSVVDLGRDVDSSVILEEVKRQGVKLVGLSALMTPTLPAMEETARLVKSATDCKIMVGGAVVTEDWAKKAGADFYGKDAKSAVNIAGEVFAKNP